MEVAKQWELRSLTFRLSNGYASIAAAFGSGSIGLAKRV